VHEDAFALGDQLHCCTNDQASELCGLLWAVNASDMNILQGAPVDQEAGEAGVVAGLVAQCGGELQQVARQLLVLRPLQHLHRLPPHLRIR